MTELIIDTLLTPEQLYALGATSGFPEGALSAFAGFESGKTVRKITHPDLVDDDGQPKAELIPALEVLRDPWAITGFTLLTQTGAMDAAFYFPGDKSGYPVVALSNQGGELRLQQPAPLAEFMAVLMDQIRLDAEAVAEFEVELSITPAWVLWAVLDVMKARAEAGEAPEGNITMDEISAMFGKPLERLHWLAAYFREALGLAKPAKDEVRNALDLLVANGLLKPGGKGYQFDATINEVLNALQSIRAHLRIFAKVRLDEGELGGIKLWILQGTEGLGLLWYEADGVVTLRAVNPAQIMGAVERLVVDPEALFLEGIFDLVAAEANEMRPRTIPRQMPG